MISFRNLLLLIVFVLGVVPLFVQAEENQVQAQVDAKKIGENDQVTLRIIARGPDAGAAQIAGQTPNSEFRLMSGPNVSTSYQFINGRSSTSKEISYVYFPLKKGSLDLPQFRVQMGDAVYTTEKITIEVVSGSVRPATNSRRNSRGDPFEAMMEDPRSREPEADIGDEVFLEMQLSKAEVFINETTEATLWLFYRPNLPITGYELEQEGKFKGIGHENIDLSKQTKNLLEQRNIKGRQYLAQPLAKWVLFPSREGEFKLEPWILKIAIRLPSRSFFSFGRQQVIVRRSAEELLKVKPFPEKNKPEDFSGLCGQFQLESETDKEQVRAGDALTVTLTLRGSGNLRSLGEIEFPEIRECKIYSPKVKDNVRLEAGQYKGSRSWEFVLVPLEPGDITIPALDLSYFNPVAEKYLSTTTKPIKVIVDPGETVNIGQAPLTPSGAPVSLKGEDIRFIHLDWKSAAQIRKWTYRQPWYIASILILVTGCILSLLFVERRRKQRSDIRSWARSRAAVAARKSLKKCETLGKKGQKEIFFQMLLEVVQKYMEDRFGLSRIELTGSHLRQRLSEAGVDSGTIQSVSAVTTFCESARYAPAQIESKEPSELVDEVRQILSRLEEVK